MRPGLNLSELLRWLLGFCTAGAVALAQLQIRTQPKSPELERQGDTSLTLPQPPFPVQFPDTTASAEPRPTPEPRRNRNLDTVVVFSANDTLLFVAAEQRLRLRGKARLVLRQQELTAEVVELWLPRSELTAAGVPDSSGKPQGTPIFRDGNQVYKGEQIRYSFQTRRGVVVGVSTHLGEGYYAGERLKQVEPGVFFVQGGCYTTCDHERPHYRFCAPRMKVVTGDRIFADPVIVYVEDLPVFLFPFGLFFPNRGGRQSGVLTPSFFFSATGGLVVEGLGYFYAPSDYWDIQLRATLRTRQGALGHVLFRYALRDWLQGSAELSGGITRPDLDVPLQRHWNINWQHRQRITPTWDLQANLRLSSPDYFRQVSTDLQQRLLESLLSTLSSSYLFESGASLSLTLQREQNLITGAHAGTLPRLTLTLPSWMPLQRWHAAPEWLRQLTLGYSMVARWQYQRSATGYAHQSSISHTPSLRVSPRLGYFVFTPSLSYEERWYFRQLRQRMRPEDSTLVQERLAGLFREYSYSIALGISTRLYGVAALPSIIGADAIRHVLQPTVTVSFTPGFPQFYSSYVDYRTGRAVTYSRFALDGGGFAPRTRSARLDYRLLNSFELRLLPAADTAPPSVVEVFRLAVAGGYAPLADSLRLSDVALDFSIPALKLLNLQGGATGSFYVEVPSPDGRQWYRINRLRIADGRFPVRWTSFRLQADFSLAGSFPLSATPTMHEPNRADTAVPPFFTLQWRLSLSAALRYDEPVPSQRSRAASLGIGLGIVLGGWDIQANGNVDVLGGQFIAPSIAVVRQLHCWELRFQWYPIGTFRGYWLRFSPKAAILRDLKYEEKTLPGL